MPSFRFFRWLPLLIAVTCSEAAVGSTRSSSIRRRLPKRLMRRRVPSEWFPNYRLDPLPSSTTVPNRLILPALYNLPE